MVPSGSWPLISSWIVSGPVSLTSHLGAAVESSLTKRRLEEQRGVPGQATLTDRTSESPCVATLIPFL